MTTLSAQRPLWKLRKPDPELTARLTSASGLGTLLTGALISRGLCTEEEIDAHLNGSLTGLHDPALLPDLTRAAERVVDAIKKGERILVHGDYDVDGVTGTSLLMRLFNLLGADAVWHIPNRFTDGYSFGEHSIRRTEDTGSKVVISVDNGTSALETITKLTEMGVDVIVTDHHEPPQGPLPPAYAIVNPKLVDAEYPFRELCGGAVAFKLAWGICQAYEGTDRVSERLKTFLVEAMAYVAVATVCDVVPLEDENRILTRFGLRALANSSHEGLRAMLDVCGLTGMKLVAEDVGFKIGPRINASGRLGTAKTAVELLLSDTVSEARLFARKLDDMNEERKRIERGVLEEALKAAEPYTDRERYPVLVVAGQGWHQGVVGIVAARLGERYSRPTIIIGLDGDEGRGSARSVEGFSVLEAMHGGKDHMLRYGGHAAAAGCEIAADSIDALRESVCDRAREMLAGGDFPAAEIMIDAEIAFADMNETLMREIDKLEPFGQGNEPLVLMSRDARVGEAPRQLGADRSHLALNLRSGNTALKAMAFGEGNRASEVPLGTVVEIVYRPRWNTFRGRTNLELLLLDFRVKR